MQRHWGARHAVILMQEVHISRSEFDSLRHLLSFVYDRKCDVFNRIPVWVNPFNEKDVLYVPTLSARHARERERQAVFSHCGAVASEDGMFSGVPDFELQAKMYVEHYWHAIDDAVKTGSAPLVLVLTGDATGGWRGDAVTHGELGIGSWAKGKAHLYSHCCRYF